MNQPTLLFLFWIIFASSHLFDVTVSSAIYQPDPTPDHSTSKRNNGFVTKHNESHFEVEVGDPTTSQPLLTAQSTSRIRLALSITHMALVILGVANIFVIVVILIKPYMRTITNVYIVSLCFADFVYLSNLLLVVSTQHNNRIWPFNSVLCTLYHGTESTGKYSSVLFVVLLAGDRFVAMCLPECVKYRTYTISITLSCMTWMVSVVVASPLYYFSELMHFKGKENTINTLCLVKWPTKDLGRLYIIGTSLLIFLIPLILIVYFYSHILAKMKEVLVRSKRMKRNSKTRAPYHRVTKLVLWVVIFHLITWSPYFIFQLLNIRPNTQFYRILANIIHLGPYINCSLNPFLYAASAENFQTAFKSIFYFDTWRKKLFFFENGTENGTSSTQTKVVTKMSAYQKLPISNDYNHSCIMPTRSAPAKMTPNGGNNEDGLLKLDQTSDTTFSPSYTGMSSPYPTNYLNNSALLSGRMSSSTSTVSAKHSVFYESTRNLGISGMSDAIHGESNVVISIATEYDNYINDDHFSVHEGDVII